MTNDDTLTAFRRWACVQFPTVQAEIQEGLFDGTSTAQGFRAGQAASAEKIKALVAVAGEVIEDYDQMVGSVRSNTMEKLRNIINGGARC
jgi:hypothetical protein